MAEDEKIIIGQRTNENKPISYASSLIEEDLIVPTEDIEMPSKGVFYPNNKKTVKIKYLTTEEEDILFSPELIKSGKVLDTLLQIVVVDKDLNPDDMIVGDRNAVLIYVRRMGIGEEYKPGKMNCPECGESYFPTVDLSKLKLKFLEEMPDSRGEYSFSLPIMKKSIKFRLLNGKDENKISKATQATKKGASNNNIKVSKAITERYRLQIMEIDGNRDKTYIARVISAMPMKDSLVFREYAKLISPGVDFNYSFECPNCGHQYEDDVPITYKLFYPNAEI